MLVHESCFLIWFDNVRLKRISLDPIHAHSWGINRHWSRKGFGTQQLPRHNGRETHICVSKLGAIDSDKGLSPVRCQLIIWKNAGLILTGPLGSYLSEIVIKAIFIQEKALEMSSAKQKPFLSRSQCVNNNNVAHSSHSGLNINDGGLWTEAI